MANEMLGSARRAKKDEFYTQLSDIEAELRHYKEHFRNKTVICNCDDVTNKRGIYPYIFTRRERYLSIRAFSEAVKLAAYERQGGHCANPDCPRHVGEKLPLAQMEADHITPWSLGGHTVAANCQMLCKECNRRKSGV